MSRPTGNAEDDNDRTDVARAIRSVKKPDPKLSTIDKIRQVVTERQYNRVNGVLVDLFTASIVVQIYDALNPENQAKLGAMEVKKICSICMKLAG